MPVTVNTNRLCGLSWITASNDYTSLLKKIMTVYWSMRRPMLDSDNEHSSTIQCRNGYNHRMCCQFYQFCCTAGRCQVAKSISSRKPFLYLSRREESSKNKLSTYLLACFWVQIFTDWPKNNRRKKGLVFHKTWLKGIESGESESKLSFNLFYSYYQKCFSRKLDRRLFEIKKSISYQSDSFATKSKL
jgi:hypothetical protein